MSLTGIGVLLIGIAFLILSIYIARVLISTATIIKGVGRTVEQLPEQLDDILNETGQMLQNTNATLADVNEKLGTLTPLFYIAEDVGETTIKLTSSINDFSSSIKKKTESTEEETRNKRLGGVYGAAALALYAIRSGNKRNDDDINRLSKFYIDGEQRAFDIDRMKEEAEEAARKGDIQ